MAEVTYDISSCMGVTTYIVMDDIELDIIRVGVNNISTIWSVTFTVNKLSSPQRTYERTWNPGDTTAFSIPRGQARFEINVSDGNLSMPDLEILVRFERWQ